MADGREVPVFDSNYWLCTITIDPDLKIKGQENAYKTIVTGAVGGAAGVIHAASSAVTDCQPNDNVEALRVFMDAAGIEARPLWKPMHKQPVYLRGERSEVSGENYSVVTSASSVAYVNGVSEALFKVGMCLPSGPYVSDEDVKYIVDTIKSAIE
jgi:dTDP-4-amino-4,6-dideoxygalactose transaminase